MAGEYHDNSLREAPYILSSIAAIESAWVIWNLLLAAITGSISGSGWRKENYRAICLALVNRTKKCEGPAVPSSPLPKPTPEYTEGPRRYC